jgi:hypothetical protein
MMVFVDPIPTWLMKQSVREIKEHVLENQEECKLPNQLKSAWPSLQREIKRKGSLDTNKNHNRRDYKKVN